MAVHRRCSIVASIAAFWTISLQVPMESSAQSSGRYANDGPNQSTYTDVAVGQMVDALLSPDLSGPAPRQYAAPHPQPKHRVPKFQAYSPPGPLKGRLVNNPDTTDGSSEFALIDRYGGVLRYVEPVDNVDLEAHVGEDVTVRRDTGDTLLASQLDFTQKLVADGGVKLAAYEEELIEPGTTDGSELAPIPEDALYLDTGIDFGGCPTCGGSICQQQNGCSLGAKGILSLRVEYLLWWFDGMYIPPLVVEGDAEKNTDPNGPAYIFTNGVVVYGNEEILDGSRDGIRVRPVFWLDDYAQWAIVGDYFGFNTVSSQFIDGGDGVNGPFVGRIFTDATSGLDTEEDVSFPGIRGTVTVDATSDFDSWGVGFRHNLCCAAGRSTGCGDAVGCGFGVGGCGSGVCGGRRGTRRVDFLFGFRSTRLDESLVITEDLETIEKEPPNTDILLQDSFTTENQFYGGEIGFLWEWEYRRWSLEFLSKLGIGNNKQQVHIHGFTSTDTNLAAPDYKVDSGLLVQPSNAGDYSRNQFTMIPEIGATLGFQVGPRLKLTAGYTAIYWGNVVRPGDQIDLHVNPEYLAPTLTGKEGPPFEPSFSFVSTDLWAHGLSFGGELRW